MSRQLSLTIMLNDFPVFLQSMRMRYMSPLFTHTHTHTLHHITSHTTLHIHPIHLLPQTDADSDDLTIHCATCGQPVTLKKAMAHFERCFNKVCLYVLWVSHMFTYHHCLIVQLEGMVSFGSIVRNEE